jgi:hypothetical protein
MEAKVTFAFYLPRPFDPVYWIGMMLSNVPLSLGKRLLLLAAARVQIRLTG